MIIYYELSNSNSYVKEFDNLNKGNAQVIDITRMPLVVVSSHDPRNQK